VFTYTVLSCLYPVSHLETYFITAVYKSGSTHANQGCFSLVGVSEMGALITELPSLSCFLPAFQSLPSSLLRRCAVFSSHYLF
jgi:hypothetical protein